MTLRTTSLLILLLATLGCSTPATEAETHLHAIHYSLDLAAPGEPDSAFHAAWARILDRVEPETQVLGLLPSTRQPALLRPLLSALRRSGAACRLLIAPDAWIGDTTSARDSLALWHTTGLLQCTNVEQVMSSFTLRQGALFAFRGLQPTLQDDGAASLVFADMVLDSQDLQTQTLVGIHGDPGLVSAFEEYWQVLQTSDQPDRVTQTETFTDVFQHVLHYEPVAADVVLDLFASLDSGLTHLARPTRLRILAPRGMSQPLLEGIEDMELRHEVDVLILWGAADSLETELAYSLFARRIRPILVGAGTPLLLIDGPFGAEGRSLPLRKRLLLFGQQDFLHPSDPAQGGLLLQLSNEVLFNLADQHWRSLWEL